MILRSPVLANRAAEKPTHADVHERGWSTIQVFAQRTTPPKTMLRSSSAREAKRSTPWRFKGRSMISWTAPLIRKPPLRHRVAILELCHRKYLRRWLERPHKDLACALQLTESECEDRVLYTRCGEAERFANEAQPLTCASLDSKCAQSARRPNACSSGLSQLPGELRPQCPRGQFTSGQTGLASPEEESKIRRRPRRSPRHRSDWWPSAPVREFMVLSNAAAPALAQNGPAR